MQNTREMMESSSYNVQTAIINREVNFGDPFDEYIPDYMVFVKSPEERVLADNLKARWRINMRKKWGESWTKHSASRKHGEFHNRMN